MSVYSVLIGLQASFPDGREVTTQNFLAPLGIGADDRVESTLADAGTEASGMIYFAVVRLSDCTDADIPSELFFERIHGAFEGATRFLDRRSPETFGRLRSSGLSLRIFVEVRMDEDQMELDFPAAFMAACGRHALGVYVISNDIPVSDLLA